ncbi:PHD finger protein [Auxenochlorella protothecoides]|uniref:PHD finger protein n=1 Tax=Auxenochlorella protothecoides TaxID=3075 RepID=V5NDK3_AUXPR|nr:PHD finger protein [Auxenochlorella protothecoides]AHA86557.1 PHD-typetranscription factor [Auxenochlorella protothecoides]KFM23982.1 PHD finger protein [Auxenochlorella protothecoides]
MAGAVSPPETLAGFEATVTQWLKQNGSPVTLTKMKGVSGWLLALPEGPTLQVFREETGPGSLADPTSLAAIAAASARGRALALAQTALASPPPDDPAAQSYTAPASVFECPRHVLHGMVHGNGYGHLLRVNGVEGQGGAAGSGPRISGRTVMLLWTQLCARLAATAISTEDVSNKGGMDLRVLHTAAHLSTWYGQFGFDFGRGAYNITREQWAEAARAVHAAPLRSLVDDFHCVDDAVVGIVQRYGLPMEEPEVGVRASPATSRRTYYNVCVLDARQPDGAARAPEYQVQYHSGATEWMGLEDIAWTHVAKSREALGCLAAFEQHLGCKRCSGGPPGCAYCWKAALADLREGRLGSERAEGKTKSQLIKSSSPPGAGRARGGGGGAPARGHTGGQLAFRAPCAECGGAACSSHDDAMVDGSTGSSEQGHAPAAEGLGAWLVPFRHPTGAPATDAGGAPPATATPAAAPRVPAAAAPGHDLAEGSQKDGARCQPSVFGEGHTSAVVSPAGEQLPLVPGGCSPAGGSDKGVARAQVLRDLRYLYEAVLTGRGPAAARVLRDCKLFVRDVRPAWAPPPSGMLRVALSAQLPPNFQLAHSRTRPSPRKGTASPVVASSAPNNHHPSHTSPPTPATAMRQLPLAPAPLALDLPADIDLGGTALAFTAALGEAYVAFQNYVPLILLPSPGASGWKAVPAATDATRLATVLPETACSAEAGGLRLLWMGGKGLDRNPAWWRQGGHEDWVVACSCGTRDDDGERMLSCDACGRWHHWRCAGLAEADPDPAAWQCPSCSPG